MKIKLLLITIFIQFSSIIYGQQLSPEKIKSMNSDTLKKYMCQTMENLSAPGLAVAIFTSDIILNEEVAGVRRLHTNDSIKLTDRFHLGSCGKAITGFVAGILVEKGLIRWNTKVLDVFPELKDNSNVAYQNVTLNELLSHRSRVSPYTEDEEWELLPNFQETDNMKRRYAFTKWLLSRTPVEIDSVKKFTYSNAGYTIAASMMEKVTDKQWETLINDELFTPLNIHASYGWPALTDKNQPWGHWVAEGDSMLTLHSPNDDYKLDEIITPAGNYSLSIIDYVKFLQLNLIGISGRDTILKSETYKYLHYCHLDSTEYHLVRYSIGWGSLKTPDEYTISTHAGTAGTFYCWTILYKELDLGLAIIVNSGGDKTEESVKNLRKMIISYYR